MHTVEPDSVPEEGNPTQLEACRAYARMMNTLDTRHIEPWLADDMKYSSQWVFEEIVGKHAYLEYIGGKLRTIKRSGSRAWAEIAYADESTSSPCVVIAQPTQDDLKATLLIEMAGGQIDSMHMCSVPAPDECRRTGEFPA